MEFIFQDLRLALRGFARRPLYRTVAVSIMALGLAAAVSVFTYVNAFNQPFPGAHTKGLVQLFGSDDENPYLNISFLDFQDYAESARTFDGMAASQSYYAASVRHEAMTEVAFVEAVSGDYFRVMGVGASRGRPLALDDDRLSADPAAVISYDWWQSRWNGDPEALGSTLYLNYRPFTIVGVADPDFVGPTSDTRPHVWIPIAHFRDRYTGWDRMAQNRDLPLVRVYGRLRPGESRVQAQDELARLAQGLDESFPRAETSRRVQLEDATWIDPRVRMAEDSRNRLIMYGAAGFLFLVCANVANLLFSVFSNRKREVALQAAMGASPGRLLRGLLLENLLLAFLAGGLALALAVPISARMGSYFARPSVWGENVSREFSLDMNVLLFALLAALLTGLLAGGLPALRAVKRDVLEVLRADSADRVSSGRIMGLRIPGARELLISSQVALSVILLVVSGLVLRTLNAAGSVDPGFQYEQLIGSHISTSSTGVQVEERERFFRELEASLEREPWVVSATFSAYAPLSGHGSINIRVEDQEELSSALVSQVHEGFFQKLGIPLLEGRAFAPFDTAGGGPVVVLNRPAAEQFFPGGGAVGSTLWVAEGGGEDQPYQVAGVVGDVKARDFLGPPEPTVYRPYAQQAYGSGSGLLVTTAGSPREAVPLLQQWLRAYEPHLAIVNAITYQEVVGGALYTQRMNAEMFSVLAILGLILAAVGIFSVVSLTVSQRTREMGVRKALGATRSDINALVVRQALRPVLLGLVVGLGVALGFSTLVESLLFGVEPWDPAGVLGGSVVLLVTAMVAAYLPARRAGGVDAVRALKAE
jgi:predicted permease